MEYVSKKKYVTIIEKISDEDIQKMIEYMKYYLKEYRNNRSNNLLRKIKEKDALKR